MSTPIEDYGIIGNTYTTALVPREGSIDWLCLPRFDWESVFAALLGGPEHGRWLISPADRLGRLSRCYRGETGILETRFETPEGNADRRGPWWAVVGCAEPAPGGCLSLHAAGRRAIIRGRAEPPGC